LALGCLLFVIIVLIIPFSFLFSFSSISSLFFLINLFAAERTNVEEGVSNSVNVCCKSPREEIFL